MVRGWGAALVFLLLSTGLAGATDAVYTESFDGPDRQTYLDGNAAYGKSGAWDIDAHDGALHFENLKSAKAFHYVYIPRVQFGDSRVAEVTSGANISATVTVSGRITGAAGVVVDMVAGGERYLFFGVGPEGSYRCLEKEGTRLQSIKLGKSQAINGSGTNVVSAERIGGAYRFSANGTVLLTVPLKSARSFNNTGIVGIGTLGIGHFAFEEVAIRRALPASAPPSSADASRASAPPSSADASRASAPPASAPPASSGTAPFGLRLGVRPDQDQPEARTAAPACEPKPVPVGAEVATATLVDDARLATVGFDTPDHPTALAEVTVEEGGGPIALILASRLPVIWRIVGAVDRVVQADLVVEPLLSARAGVPVSNGTPVGVVGLSADRLHVATGRDCPRIASGGDKFRQLRENGKLARLLAVESILPTPFDKTTVAVSLPSGRTTTVKPEIVPPGQVSVPDGFEPKSWRFAAMRHRGGYAEVDIDKVVAFAPLVDFSPFPGLFGLSHLAAEGRLDLDIGHALQINAPIERLPVYEDVFMRHVIVAKGVPLPAGLPPGTCALREETGEVLLDSPACGQ